MIDKLRCHGHVSQIGRRRAHQQDRYGGSPGSKHSWRQKRALVRRPQHGQPTLIKNGMSSELAPIRVDLLVWGLGCNAAKLRGLRWSDDGFWSGWPTVVVWFLDGIGVSVAAFVDAWVAARSSSFGGAFEDFLDGFVLCLVKSFRGKMPPGWIPDGGRC